MGDLRNNISRKSELINHITSREGIYLWLYSDHLGWVTIGIGELVDRPRGTTLQRESAARDWFQSSRVDFSHKRTNALANEAELNADWRRAESFYHTDGPTPARNYARPTHLRITDASARLLLGNVINRLAARLYRHAPYMVDYDERVTMALVDTRYNPAGVAIFDLHDDPRDNFHRDIPALWDALDPSSPNFNYSTAEQLFKSIWAHRGTAVYKARHRLRVQMFEEGITTMRAADALRDGVEKVGEFAADLVHHCRNPETV